MAMHQIMVANLGGAAFSVEPRPWMRGWSPDRLGGWLGHNFGPITLAYEFNSQEAVRHLNLAQLKSIGAVMADSVGQFFAAKDGQDLLTVVDDARRERLARWANAPAVAGQDAIESEAAHFGNTTGAGNLVQAEQIVR
jgi:hypothetical protein